MSALKQEKHVEILKIVTKAQQFLNLTFKKNFPSLVNVRMLGKWGFHLLHLIEIYEMSSLCYCIYMTMIVALSLACWIRSQCLVSIYRFKLIVRVEN